MINELFSQIEDEGIEKARIEINRENQKNLMLSDEDKESITQEYENKHGFDFVESCEDDDEIEARED